MVSLERVCLVFFFLRKGEIILLWNPADLFRFNASVKTGSAKREKNEEEKRRKRGGKEEEKRRKRRKREKRKKNLMMLEEILRCEFGGVVWFSKICYSFSQKKKPGRTSKEKKKEQERSQQHLMIEIRIVSLGAVLYFSIKRKRRKEKLVKKRRKRRKREKKKKRKTFPKRCI